MYRYPQMYAPGQDAALVSGMFTILALSLAVVAGLAVIYFVWWLFTVWHRHDPKKYRPSSSDLYPYRDHLSPDDVDSHFEQEPPDPYQGQLPAEHEKEPDPYQSHWQPDSQQDDMPWRPEPNSGGTWRPESSEPMELPKLEPEAPRKVSSVRLLYVAAFEMLTDAELEELRHKAGDVIHRLRRASHLLVNGQTQEAENVCVVARGAVRRALGKGQHWLEAVILADLGALCHEGKKTEDAEYYFERAETVALPWLKRYPWLRSLVSTRRLRD